ncbi:MAG: sulfatase [Candidatus Hydrogenedentes bacterium]|nr:sulfatase [Candidatus Hydrogenedentota bacterium]
MPAHRRDSEESQRPTALSRRGFLQRAALTGIAAATCPRVGAASPEAARSPNILLAIADDWTWPYASYWGCPQLNTPNFDRVAREGMLCTRAFAATPQCSPNRAALLTGRNIWQLEEAGTHASIFPKTYPVYTDLLEQAGYHVGYTGKGWGPGDWQGGGWTRNPAGTAYNDRKAENLPLKGLGGTDYAVNFEDFLTKRPSGAPFAFWFGSNEPHRLYEEGSGVSAGKDPARVTPPRFLPDHPAVRSDMLDYFLEIEYFDAQLGLLLKRLEEIGELDNTLVVVTGDNGMPFPKAKANVYEYGTHVPLALRWPNGIRTGAATDALISSIDFAPTFLELAGIPIPESVTGSSLTTLFRDPAAAHCDYVLTGRERHTHARYDNWGYPSRAIRTKDYLYVRNFKPDRWPAGDPDGYHDIDNGPSKSLLLEQRAEYPDLFSAAMGKRPEEELFSMKDDPECMHNLAGRSEWSSEKKRLAEQLHRLLAEQGDPRLTGNGDVFESYPRVSAMRPELGGFAEQGAYNPAYAPPR